MSQENIEISENAEAAIKISKFDKFFDITARKSSIRTEIFGGITTFFAMCYIMFVNPSQITGASGGPLWNAVYIATAIGAIIGTILMALVAKMPLAQAPGMGLNAFFFVSFMLMTVAGTFDEQLASFQYGMSVIVVAGALFLLLSLTKVREKIAQALPDCLKKSIAAGIGLFIAFIGLKNAGLVQFNPYTFVQIGNFAIGSSNPILDTNAFPMVVNYQNITWYSIVPALVAFIGLLTMGILRKSRFRILRTLNVVLGIAVGTALYYLFNINNPDPGVYGVFSSMVNPGQAFVDWANYGLGAFAYGFQYWDAENALNIVILIITFFLIDMFDTLGTLQGTCSEAGMLDKNGVPMNLAKCLLCDSIATVTGGVSGTSTVTTYVESAAGVSAGARTGFSSIIVAGLFVVAMFLSPIASIIPSGAVASALIYVGVLMMGNVKEIDFSEITSALPAFITLIMMPLTYSISNGIGMGMITYIIIKLITTFMAGKEAIVSYFGVVKNEDGVRVYGDFLSKDIYVLVIAILFAVRFFVVYV
ncbi:MAG: NCS2 family permease [Clostridiales bacterium]|nr:NCS2 family permease [Clostridiales bacterium]